jgi:isopenicillin N synthase-like dioxygenase
MVESTIPVVDLAALRGGGQAEAQALCEGLERYGFVALANHGLDPQMLAEAYEVSARLFALPVEVKKQYEDPATGRQRGYTSFGVEHAKDQAAPDLKEFWHVGRELGAEHDLTVRGLVPRNLFPKEVPEFERVMLRHFGHMEAIALDVLDVLGGWFGKGRAYFREMVQDGNSVLRIINYPDMGGTVPVGAVRAAAHEDINLLTLLPASTRPGLEILTREGAWLPVYTPPDVIILDTGDMMARVTANKLPAVTHRVVNPEGSDGGRMSIPFFMHPHSDHVLTPWVEGFAAPIRTDDFLKQRLREIGVG